MGQFGRRRFLQGVAGTVATGAALTACSKSKTKDTAANNAKVQLPTFRPYSGVRPDLAGDAAGIEQTFLRYPASPVQAITDKPGSGGSVSALTIVYTPVPPVGKNKYWQALNKALGVDLKMQLTPSADYQNKFSTVIAGGNVPDFVQVAGAQSQLPKLLAAEFQDLTDFVSGDAVKDYPFLANLPTDSWKATVYNGGIYGLPIPRAAVGPIMFSRSDIIKQKGLNGDPTSFAEFLELCKELTDHRHNKWSMATPSGALIFVQEMLGVANGWKIENGKFTSALELPETKEAVAAVAKLAKAGCFHPDSLSTTVNTGDLFGNGTTPLIYNNYTIWGAYMRTYKQVSPTINLAGMIPPSYDGKTKAVLWEGSPSYSLTAVKKGSKTRVKELLRIANWLAAPFGTREYLLRKYGVAGVDYKLDQTDPILDAQGQTEVANFTATYIADSPQVIYEPGMPTVAKAEHTYQEKAIPMTIPIPTLGLFSDTSSTKGAQLNTMITNTQNAIWQGHKPMSAWDDAVAQWRTIGGNAIRKEYQESYAKAH
jgi:putative aldouronate transport system substrate-binding protein